MSFLSTTENVGFSGISQNISEASCASQYKMAVESVPVGCNSEVNMFIHDSSGDEHTYMPHLSDNFFHTKFKIDPNDLYTFHDSDIVAGEVTVSHTEDNLVFPDNMDVKYKSLVSPTKEIDLLHSLMNGEVKEEKKCVVSNGHYSPLQMKIVIPNKIDAKKVNTKVQKTKQQTDVTTESIQSNTAVSRHPSIQSPKNQPASSSATSLNSHKVSIKNSNGNNEKPASGKSSSETFLDVFKREQGLIENLTKAIKKEANPTLVKAAASTPKKQQSVKPTSQTKAKRGRGPTVHEALQRIPSQQRAVPLPITQWHAPGEELFHCGPLDDKKPNAFRQLESSSSDDDNMPEFESGFGAVCVEESAAESRGARLALRRAAMRRHVARTATALHLTKSHKEQRALATLIKKQLSGPSSSSRLPTQTVNHLIAMRGMTTLLTPQERRQLRENGWSGGESGRQKDAVESCYEEKCTNLPLPCGRYCLSHVTLAPEQRLYAACAAVFAGGERCKQPLLPLQEQTPLCPEHAWKRDNYELLSRECKPQKVVRARAWVAARAPRARPPRRPKRRRRLVPRRSPAIAPTPTSASVPAPPPSPAPAPATARAHEQSLAEINVCSNSSTYDSSEDTAVGGLSESEYIGNNSHELEVGQEHDILDPSMLSQIPDEAFTEFFNQAEGGASFAESSELAAALEAVLEERVLDERALDIADVFPHVQVKTKIQVPASVEMSSSAPS